MSLMYLDIMIPGNILFALPICPPGVIAILIMGDIIH